MSLILAIASSNIEFVNRCLKREEPKAHHVWMALRISIDNNKSPESVIVQSLQIFELLLNAGKVYVNTAVQKNVNPKYRGDDWEIVESSTNPNATTLLQYAIAEGANVVIVKRLIDRLVEEEVKLNNRALDYAVCEGARAEMVKMLHDRLIGVGIKLKSDALQYAIAENANAAVVNLFIDQLIEAGVKLQNIRLQNAIARNASDEVVQLLIEAGVNLENDLLRYAIAKNASVEVIEVLIRIGVELKSDSLQYAIARGASDEVLWLLIDAGAKFSEEAHRIVSSDDNDKMHCEGFPSSGDATSSVAMMGVEVEE